MASRHYHFSFPTHRSAIHLAISSLIVGVPLTLFVSFSYLSGFSMEQLGEDLGLSLVRLFVSFVIAAALGWSMAVFLTRGWIGEFFLPMFDILQSLPSFAILPLAVLTFGASNATIIFFLVLAIIWPIVFTTASSVKQSDRDWDGVIVMSHIRRFSYIKYYLAPLSLPGLITGSIVGMGDGWEALVATEIIVNAKTGVGAFFTGFATSPGYTTFGLLIFLSIVFAINKTVWLPLLEWSHRVTA